MPSYRTSDSLKANSNNPPNLRGCVSTSPDLVYEAIIGIAMTTIISATIRLRPILCSGECSGNYTRSANGFDRIAGHITKIITGLLVRNDLEEGYLSGSMLK